MTDTVSIVVPAAVTVELPENAPPIVTSYVEGEAAAAAIAAYASAHAEALLAGSSSTTAAAAAVTAAAAAELVVSATAAMSVSSHVFTTKAEAIAAISIVVDQDFISVLVDESKSGAWSIYRKSSGSYVHILAVVTTALEDILTTAPLTLTGRTIGLPLDTDANFVANSDNKVASQKATKTYMDAVATAASAGHLLAANNLSDVANSATARSNLSVYSIAQADSAIAAAVTGLLDYKGAIDCSANSNYPSALKGDSYVVSLAGKIGGPSGQAVEAGDFLFAKIDSAGGTDASVGANWDILQYNQVITVQPYILALCLVSIPTALETLVLHLAGRAFTIPANFAGGLLSSVGINPTATFAIDIKKNGTTIGAISISTAGVVTATTVGGTSKSIAQGDLLKFVAPATADATFANAAFTIVGA